MKKKENWLAKFWHVIVRRNVRLWLFRCIGFIGGIIGAVGSWLLTLAIICIVAIILSQLGILAMSITVGQFILGFSAGIALMIGVYLVLRNMSWARKMSEMSEDEFTNRSVITGIATLFWLIIIAIIAGLHFLTAD